MPTLEVRTLSGRGRAQISDSPLGRGGEGSVYLISSHDVPGLPPAAELVAKIYHKPKEGNRRDKVIAMVSSPPKSTMFAWPLAILADQSKNFVGYIMEKFDGATMKEWAHLAHTRTRKELAPDFDVKYALVACLNLAIAGEAAHEAGHVLGDVFNESNAAVGADSSVLLLDTDSAQIATKDGRIFRCEVGKPEYTAPELIGRPLRDQDRTEASDAFAFGVMLFQMLTGGAHPTDGVYKGSDDPPSITSKISQGILPSLRDESARGFGPVPRIATSGIPSRLRKLMVATSAQDPSHRPPFGKIIEVLEAVVEDLVQCPVDNHHWFAKADGTCGWCAHAAKGQLDPWGEAVAPSRSQSKLPPVSFGQAKKPTGQAPRAQINAPRHQSGYGQTAVQQSYQQSNPTARQHTPSTPQPMSPQAQLLAQQALNGAANNPSGGASQGYFPPQQQQPQPQQQIPEKIRGKMTVVYQDGSYGPRPSLGVLFTQNNRLWRQAIVTEWPDLLKFWWPRDRPLAQPLAIWLSPLISGGLMALVSWLLFTYVFVAPTETWIVQLGLPTFLLGALISGAIYLVWWINCWTARGRARKDYGSLDRLKKDPVALTITRGACVTLGYIFTPVVIALVFVVSMIKAAIRGDSQTRRRW